MGIFGRMWRVIKGWFTVGVERAENPEVILAEAQEAMKRELVKAKEEAVMAIQQRNLLRNMLQQSEKKAADLDALARQALRGGKEDLARQLLVEKGTYEEQVESLRKQLEQAEVLSEQVKVSIQRMEEQVRQQYAQKLALVAGWKQAKIQERLSQALSGISLEGPMEAFRRAEERIQAVQAKSEARMELGRSGLQEEVEQLQMTAASAAAQKELERLKDEMGTEVAQTAGAATSDVDEALEKLRAEVSTEGQEVKQPQQQEEQQQQEMRRNIEV